MIARFSLLGRRMAGIARKELLLGRVINNSMALRDCRGDRKLVFWFGIEKVPHEDVTLDIDPLPFNGYDQLQPQDPQQIDLLTLSKSLHYPYIDFPSNLIQAYHQNPSNDQSIKDIIAFRCLKNISQPQLFLAVQILDPFMANFKKANPNQYDMGRQIFTAYFQKHRQRLERGYKEGTNEDKIKYLIVLNNNKLNNSTAERAKEINEAELLTWDRTGLGVVYYSQLLIKSNLPYEHLFKIIQQRLSDESQGTASDRIKIAEVLLAIPSFEHCYPKQIIDASLAVLSQNIELVSNLQMLQVMRFIYELKSKESIRLAQKMIKYLAEIDFRTELNRVKMFVPLVLKLLKYAQATEIDIQPMLLEFLRKQETFAPLFNQFPKIYFHTLLFLWIKTGQSQAMKQKMKEHIINCLRIYKTVQVSRKDQLTKLFALLSNHEDLLNADEKLQAKSDLLTIMSRSYDLQVHYKCLHFLIRDNDSFFQIKQNQQMVNKHLQLFFQSTCERNNIEKLQIKSHLQQNIHLAYLLTINQFTSVKEKPHIEGYDFSKEEMICQQTFQRLIAYLDIAPKSEHLHEAFTNLEPFALYHLGRRKLSYRTIITLLQLGAKISYDRKHLYQQIEKAFFQILVKYDNFTIKMQDLHVIKNNMIKRNLGSPIFRELILRSIEKPGKWKAHRKKYIEDQKKYWSELNKDNGDQQTD